MEDDLYPLSYETRKLRGILNDILRAKISTHEPLFLIFVQVLGTPKEEDWPGISRSEELANYK